MVVLNMSYGRGIEQTLAIVHRLLFETIGAILQVIHPFGHSTSFCILLHSTSSILHPSAFSCRCRAMSTPSARQRCQRCHTMAPPRPCGGRVIAGRLVAATRHYRRR